MSDLIGQTFSNFRVVERIGGTGAFAVSYRAEEVDSRSPVTLKILPPDFGREERKRMMSMAAAASELGHPNVETLIEIGETDDGRLFWCTEWQPGETLDLWLERGEIEPSDALDIGVQMAKGLERSHRSRIAHGALRPDQVKLHDTHRVEILGFGLCAVAGEGLSARLGEPLTALAYRSPEQVRGDRVGPRTDVWSLGAILYEMLAGRRPFEGSTVGALAEGILGGSPPPISEVCSAAPAGLERVLTRALAKEVGARFSGIAELGHELLPFAAELGEPARRSRAPQKPQAAESKPETLNPEPAEPPAETTPAAAEKATEAAPVETVGSDVSDAAESIPLDTPATSPRELPPALRWALMGGGLLGLLAALARLLGAI
ncbi:MAG: serine/threonine-protein kinase [Thermoanaerobaculia bacterium]